MRKITITYELAADTTATERVSCEHREPRMPGVSLPWNDRCNAFDVVLNKVSRRKFVKRAPECIAAEKAGSGKGGDDDES